MNELIHRIDNLERQIQEKENELQLLKDDLEAIRAALESALEEQQNAAEALPEKSQPTEVPEPEPPVSEVESISEAEEVVPEPTAEQQHEAIMRTIEEFSKDQTQAHATKPSQPVVAAQTLSDKASQSKLTDLKKAFGLNERFLYANELFNGDMSAFTRAIEELNHLESIADAERLLEETFALRYKWDDDDEAVIAFRSTVSRRFV